MMKKYDILGLVYKYAGKVTVEAENDKEALEKAEERFLADDGDKQELLFPIPEDMTNLYVTYADNVDIILDGKPANDQYFAELKKKYEESLKNEKEETKDDKTDNAS